MVSITTRQMLDGLACKRRSGERLGIQESKRTALPHGKCGSSDNAGAFDQTSQQSGGHSPCVGDQL
ncbi:hypothetical protein [Neotabrizicola sp. sgz301269]|uniref:hypothetical protein n=1 Tax=Neotabrizicola sp. sgz301269 TaxID=3276282 RepID=UPI00376F90AF